MTFLTFEGMGVIVDSAAVIEVSFSVLPCSKTLAGFEFDSEDLWNDSDVCILFMKISRSGKKKSKLEGKVTYNSRKSMS